MSAPAHAAVSTVQNGEPTYTKGTTNTWWFSWNDPGSTTSDPYDVCFVLYKDGLAQWNHDTDCFVPSGANTASGTNTSGTIKFSYSVQSGHQYTVVANDFYDQCGPGCGIRADGSIEASSTTTIDNSNPSDVVGVDGPNTYTNDPTLAIHIDYSDAISPPFPGPYGGATVDCTQLGTTCSSGNYDPGCSHAESYNSLTNSFDCDITWNGGDGKIYYCADEADSATPDQPGNVNQFAQDQSQYANHSGFGCGYITLDRTPPVVTATANGQQHSITVTQGNAVNFAASATDSGAGPDGVYAWTFGDNTGGGAGATVAHTYTQVGTYVATVTTHDNAKTIHSSSAPYYTQGSGNAGTATVTVTVVAPQSGGSGGSTGGSGGSTGGTGGSGGSTGGSGGSTGGSSGGSVTPPPSTGQVGQQGGGGTQTLTVGTGTARVSLVAPKKLSLRKAHHVLLVMLGAPRAGTIQLLLASGRRHVAHGKVNFNGRGKAGFRLKLPASLKRGRYRLTISFTPRGGGSTLTRTVTIIVVK